jgi:DNA mismatch repair ATPase MutL
MRAATPRATIGSTVSISRCFAAAPVRHEWLSRASSFAAQIGELHSRIHSLVVSQPHLTLSVNCDHEPLVSFVNAHTSISERIGVIFPKLVTVPIRSASDMSALRVTHAFAAETLVANARSATQLVFLNGAPLSTQHHEQLFDSIDSLFTAALAPHSRTAARLHASFAVFFDSNAPGVIVAQHCERITDCACVNAMANALRTALKHEPRRTTASAPRTIAGTSATAPVPVIVEYAPISSTNNAASQPRQSLSELFSKWVSPAPARRLPQQHQQQLLQEETAIQFNRADIDEWRFVGQCDRKYLLLWWPQRQMLMAADQHAVDERINLERLEAQVFGDIEAVARRCQPLTGGAIEWHVTREQMRLLSDSVARAAVARWGFRYSWRDESTLRLSQQPTIESTALDLDAMLDIAACATQAGSSRPQTVERILHAKVWQYDNMIAL